MEAILIENVIKAVNGVINKNFNTNLTYITGVSTDTRTLKKGDLFIPLIGENFDGHNFISLAFEKGASACLTQKDILENNNILIKVSDTKQALKDLAKYYRNLFKIPIIAITGSSGKTTTKDMIAFVLSQKFNVLKTMGNFNNEIGLPLTVFNIDKNTEIAVLEMGMNNFGEIRNLSEIAKPTVGIITNIGVSHIENLGSREGIFLAKNEIFDFLQENGVKIFNGDDDILYGLKNPNNDNCKEKYFYSINNHNCHVFAIEILKNNIDGIHAKINCFDEIFDLNLNIPGKHTLSNALCAIVVAKRFDLSISEIKSSLENFKSSKMRMSIKKCNNYNIINDVYNANPNSMKVAIDVLAKSNTRKIAILGDMLELGKFTKKYHYEIGEYIVENKIDEAIFIGKFAKYMFEGATDKLKHIDFDCNLNYYETQDEFLNNLDNFFKFNDTILVKASRGMHLEKTIDKIMR